MKTPLAFFTFCFSLGVVCAYLIKVPFWFVYVLGVTFTLVSLLLIKRELSFHIIFFCSVFILGILRFEVSSFPPKRSILRYLRHNNDQVYAIKGYVNNNPAIQEGRTMFIFRVEGLQFNQSSYKSCGDILVYLKDTKTLSYGEELILFGKARRPHRAFKSGVAAVMHLQNSSKLIRLNKNKGDIIRRSAFYLKNKIEGIFLKHLSPLAAGIVDAMVLGEKGHISPVIYDAMVKSGTVHILVVSGFNVGIIAFISGLFLKILRIPRKLRYFLIIVVLILYCFITGASTPVVRATVMGIFLILGYILRREADITNSFSLAMLFILFVDPQALFSISFQLSYISVAAIVYLYPRLRSFLKVERIKINPLKLIVDGCLVSFSAWLGTMGFIAYYFKIFSPVTLLANIFVVPLATLITLSGLSMVVVALISPFLAGPLASTNEILVILLLKTNTLFINLPFAYFYL
jgi:ComEC/Rec2-related protein